DVPLDHRPQDRPPGAPDPRGRRHVPLVRPADRLRHLAPRDDRPLGLPASDLHRHRDPRRLPGPRGDGADGRRPAARLSGHLGRRRRDGGGRRGAAHHPVFGAPVLRRRVRAPHLHDLRARWPREHGRRLRRLGRHERDHLDRRRRDLGGEGVRDRVRRVQRDGVRPSGRPAGAARVRPGRVAGAALLAVLALGPVLPMGGMRQYVLHVLIQIFVWSFIGGAWSLMGRFGLVSLGHGAFLGLGAYTVTLLWNAYGLTPWLGGLRIWYRVDRSMARAAMEAIGEDETAAASVGIHVTRFKMGITMLSASLTAVGGVAYAQYITYVNPDTLAGIGVSLRIVFAV